MLKVTLKLDIAVLCIPIVQCKRAFQFHTETFILNVLYIVRFFNFLSNWKWKMESQDRKEENKRHFFKFNL